MKYVVGVTIRCGLEKTVRLFTDPNHLKDWQTGFESLEVISGKPGETGSKSKLKYLMGKRKIEMIETIELNNLPSSFIAIYETKGVWNKVENEFREVDEETTYWQTKNVFKFTGFMKIFGVLMPKAFKKQSCKYPGQFKAFAERQ